MSKKSIKVFKIYDGQNAFFHEDVADLAQHIAQLCDIDQGHKIVIETMKVKKKEFDAMPVANLDL